jgi:hypothetical protein
MPRPLSSSPTRSRSFGVGALAALAVICPTANAQDPAPTELPPAEVRVVPPDWGFFRTPDGRRFLLVDLAPGRAESTAGADANPVGGPPLLRWARATPAGANVDPPGLLGLAHACVRASFRGIGSAPSGDESSPPTDAWRARLAGIPATGPRLLEIEDASIVSFVAPPDAAGDLARLLRARDASARLPDVDRHLTEIRIARADASDPMAALRDEVLGLSFYGTARYRSEERERAPTPDAVRAHWRLTQAPAAGLDVLVAPIPIASWKPVLTAMFPRPEGASAGAEDGDAVPPPTLQTPVAAPRPGRRRSSIAIDRLASADVSVAVAIAFPLPDVVTAPSPTVVRQLLAWLEGPTGYLAQQLRAAGRPYRDIRVDVAAPFPGERRPALFVISAWLPALGEDDPPQTVKATDLELEMFRALSLGARRGPTDEALARTVHEALGAHARTLQDPTLLAETLAVACGVIGEDPSVVLAPPRTLGGPELGQVLLDMLQGPDREVVLTEVPR